jgi:hypothetical protein
MDGLTDQPSQGCLHGLTMGERLRMIAFVFYAMLYLEDLIAMNGSLKKLV